MIFKRVATAALLAAALLGCRAEPQSATVPPAAARSQVASGLDVVALSVCGARGCRSFDVEVARTEAEQAQGLMFREQLAPEKGMIFPFPSPRPASFWMKNTLIPLDIIFVRANGTIARIAANTVPHSLDPVAVDEPVGAVLEIAGGRSAALGIREGDRVSWPGGPAR